MIDKSAFIHPTAIVEDGAVIGANAHIGPFCIVGPQVEIGEGTVLKSSCGREWSNQNRPRQRDLSVCLHR